MYMYALFFSNEIGKKTKTTRFELMFCLFQVNAA